MRRQEAKESSYLLSSKQQETSNVIGTTASLPKNILSVGSSLVNNTFRESEYGGGDTIDLDDSPHYNMSPNYNNNNNNSSSSSRIGSIKPNYYQTARNQSNNNSSNDENGKRWIFEVLQDMLRFIYTAITTAKPNFASNNLPQQKAIGDFPQPEIALNTATKQKFEKFKQFAVFKYDPNNEKHEKQLLKLWDVCMNYKKKKGEKIKLSDRISAQWRELGFQGNNPATDFRGSGILGLHNLIYFATKYPEQFHLMFVRTRKNSNTSYPFVIAGLNVTMMLHDILGIGMNAKKCKNLIARKRFIEMLVEEEQQSIEYKTQSSDDEESEKKKKVKEANLLIFDEEEMTDPTSKKAEKKKSPKKKNRKSIKYHYVIFHELYVTGFILLNQQWYRAKASSYFNFPDVLDKTRQQMEDLIELKFTCLSDIVAYNSK